MPYLSKLESIASSAVRAAGMVEADLIVVYTNTGGWGGFGWWVALFGGWLHVFKCVFGGRRGGESIFDLGCIV